MRDDLSYNARAICDSISRRIVNLRAREATGVLRGTDAIHPRLAGSPLFAASVCSGGNGFGKPVRVETLCANRMRLLNSRKRAGCSDTFLLLSDLSDFPRLAGGTS